MYKFQFKLMVFAFVIIAVCVVSANSAAAQDSSIGSGGRAAMAAASADNLDLQLYALVASNTPGEAGTVPSALNSVAREIRSTFQIREVRVAAILQYRVENNDRLEASGMANSILTAPSAFPPYTTINYGFSIASIKLNGDTARPLVQLTGFRFSLQMPFQTGTTKVGDTNQPLFDYRGVGIAIGVTLPLGEPSIIGSFTIGKVDEMVVLVMVAKPVKER
ncbi:MAG: hypothetical protein ABIP75_04810 [Pyrinomonadaceae bacterium]